LQAIDNYSFHEGNPVEELMQLLEAQRAAYMALVRALHEAGVLPVDAVLRRLEATADFRQASFAKEKNPVLESLYLEHLRALADAYRKSQPPQSPTGDA
jgi:hypothetical protein